jgi:hypothetical protein
MGHGGIAELQPFFADRDWREARCCAMLRLHNRLGR